MRVTNDIERVPITRSGPHAVHAVIRVRRIDAMTSRGGVVLTRRTPLEVVVQRPGGGEERAAIGRAPGTAPWWAYAAAPLAAAVLARLFARRKA